MTQLYDVERICSGALTCWHADCPQLPVASLGVWKHAMIDNKLLTSFCTSLEIFQEFLQDFVDFATEKFTIQETSDSFREEFASIRFVSKGGREAEDGMQGDSYLCLKHVCLHEQAECQAKMSSCSPTIESFSSEMHPSLPAPSTSSAIGYETTLALPWFLSVSAPSSAPFSIFYTRESHTLKTIF